ncbi:LAGLIDADG family homing endonuclease [Paenisporosarcina sp. FSL H8-0542]|uniref:LAGLIDADG family homing endonuclease n=1 Tax=Paenisporosarcina sp. FSL H8-0542 TaxID=2921401 RepID=UPI00315A5759
MVKGKWSIHEVEYLINNIGINSYLEISNTLNRSIDSIQKKSISMGLSRTIRKEKWSEEEVVKLKEYYGITTVVEISKMLGRTTDSIAGKAKQLKLKGYIKNAWSENDIEFLISNFGTKTLSELAFTLGRTENSIQLKANRIGLKLPEKYNYNKDYFKLIDCEEKAYWLGFIYADGYVSVNEDARNHEFGIEIKSADYEHLNKLNLVLNGNINLSYRTRQLQFKNYTSVVNVCSLRIYSKQFVFNLIDKGVVPNKTSVLEFPKFLPKQLMRHFIRGYIEGDGYIRFRKRITGNGYGYETRLGYVCHSKQYAIELKVFLERELDLENELTFYKDGNSFSCDTANQKQLLSIIDYLYKDSTIYLDRKYITYQELNHYLLNRLAYRKK